jgi:phenylalanine-4-hydroxylase
LASRRGLGPLSPLGLCSSGCAVRWQSELSSLKALGTRAQEKALTASMVETSLGENGRTSLMFSTGEGAGSLMEVLGVFKRHGVNLTRIESRPSKRGSTFDFTVDTDMPPPTALLGELRLYTLSLLQPKRVPWFPTVLKDIDVFSTRTLDAGSELEADHPGFSDATYRERRRAIVAAAGGYRHGDSIPSVAYTPEEEATWGIVYNNLRRYTRDFACDAYNRVFPLLEQHCGYSPGRIPQLQHISDFLGSCTGFRLRPVGGLLSARDFLNGLAFRVFFSTQYIRHHSVPLYTPEPDVCHELLGHVPMFADPDFADFSHDIGLASLGASDEDIKRLAACYWFSVEFGLCMEAGQRKAYGAGLLSSFGELEYACASYRPAGGEHSIPSYVPWEPSLAARQAVRVFVSLPPPPPFFICGGTLSLFFCNNTH